MIILDIETTGLDPRKNCMVSLGAVDYDTGDEFYGECRIRRRSEVSPEAMAVNGFTFDQIMDQSKMDDVQLYMQFLHWAVIAVQRGPLLAGQQVGSLDIPFIRTIANDPDSGDIIPVWPFGYRSVDLHSVAFAKLGKSLSLDGILIALGLTPEPKPHNALTGARLERDAFKRLLA